MFGKFSIISSMLSIFSVIIMNECWFLSNDFTFVPNRVDMYAFHYFVNVMRINLF